MEIKEIVQSMLTENTGTHFLDSGGENGRQWQRNQGVDFDAQPRVDADGYVSVYHYLCEILEEDYFTEEINEVLEGKEYHWVQEVEDILIDEGYDLDFTEAKNTYNYENNISQDLLFIEFSFESEQYVILQVHGGADIRGGYTQARVFKLTGYLDSLVDIHGTIGGAYVEYVKYAGCYFMEDGTEIEVDEDTKDVNLDFHIIEL